MVTVRGFSWIRGLCLAEFFQGTYLIILSSIPNGASTMAQYTSGSLWSHFWSIVRWEVGPWLYFIVVLVVAHFPAKVPALDHLCISAQGSRQIDTLSH